MTEMAVGQTMEHRVEHHKVLSDKVYFGFWLYLMTDLLMFTVLFATYLVLHGSTFGGPGSRDLFDLPYAMVETLILLTSSFTCGLGLLAVRAASKVQALVWYAVTVVLGVSFLGMELTEFHHMIGEGHTWRSSGFLSAFYALVGTHGLHITSGLIWLLILLVYVAKRGLNDSAVRKLTLFSVFWHFLDVVWIFIFTIVYLMGVS